MNGLDCKINIPYPTVEVTEPNAEYAARLSVFFAGRDSELSALLQYTYQSQILKAKNAYISDILQCISITEMRHYEMLGEMILLLGADPRVAAQNRGRYVYWNGAGVTYAKHAERMLKDNIISERRAVASYNNFIKGCKDEKINKVIKRIVLDEEHHFKLFNSLLTEL